MICFTFEQAYQELNRAYDCYLIDNRLPDGCGLDLCKLIREITDDPIVFISSDTNESSILKSYEFDADDYIDPDFIEYLFHVLSSTNSDIAYCAFRRVSEDGRLLSTPKDHRDSHIETFSKKEALINCLRARKGFQMFVWNGLFKKNILSRFTPGRRIGQDQDFTIRTLANADRVAKGWGVHHSYRIRKGGSKSLELTKRMNFQYLALKDIKSAIENLPADKELMDAYYERCFRMDLGLIDRYSTGLLKDKDLFLTLRAKMREDSRKAYPDIRGVLLSFVLGANESCYRIAFKIIKRFQK